MLSTFSDDALAIVDASCEENQSGEDIGWKHFV